MSKIKNFYALISQSINTVLYYVALAMIWLAIIYFPTLIPYTFGIVCYRDFQMGMFETQCIVFAAVCGTLGIYAFVYNTVKNKNVE